MSQNIQKELSHANVGFPSEVRSLNPKSFSQGQMPTFNTFMYDDIVDILVANGTILPVICYIVRNKPYPPNTLRNVMEENKYFLRLQNKHRETARWNIF